MLRKMTGASYWIRTFTCLFLIGGLVFSLAAPAFASLGPQEWYLNSTDNPVTGKYMTRTYDAAVGSADISAGATRYWLADVPAVIDVKFPDGAWIIQLKTDSYWGDFDSSQCVMAVGEWNTAGSTFLPFSTSTLDNVVYDSGKHIIRVEFQLGAETIHQNSYLALSIQNLDTSTHSVITDGESSMKSPDSDPGYPTPDISPDSFASITAMPNDTYPGGQVTLRITDNNTGDVPITSPTMDLVDSSGTLNITLTKNSVGFAGGDTNNNGIFDPGETWVWNLTHVKVYKDTIFTATGHGNDPYGNDVTAPGHPTEQVEVDVTITPLVPAASNLGIGFLIGGLVVSIAFVASRKARIHSHR